MTLLDLYALTLLGTTDFPHPCEGDQAGKLYDSSELRAARAANHADWVMGRICPTTVVLCPV